MTTRDPSRRRFLQTAAVTACALTVGCEGGDDQMTDTHTPDLSGDTGGEDTRGADSGPSDTGADSAQMDTAGEDAALQDTAGQDTAGQDTAGEDTAGQDTTPTPPTDLIVPLGDHPELDRDGGILAFPKRDTGLGLGVLLYRVSEGVFLAHSDRCTHRSCRVVVDTDDCHCPCHDSRFGHDGSLLSGPADAPLDPLDVSVDGDTVTVFIP